MRLQQFGNISSRKFAHTKAVFDVSMMVERILTSGGDTSVGRGRSLPSWNKILEDELREVSGRLVDDGHTIKEVFAA